MEGVKHAPLAAGAAADDRGQDTRISRGAPARDPGPVRARSRGRGGVRGAPGVCEAASADGLHGRGESLAAGQGDSLCRDLLELRQPAKPHRACESTLREVRSRGGAVVLSRLRARLWCNPAATPYGDRGVPGTLLKRRTTAANRTAGPARQARSLGRTSDHRGQKTLAVGGYGCGSQLIGSLLRIEYLGPTEPK
jgi:hypothetical protein